MYSWSLNSPFRWWLRHIILGCFSRHLLERVPSFVNVREIGKIRKQFTFPTYKEMKLVVCWDLGHCSSQLALADISHVKSRFFFSLRHHLGGSCLLRDYPKEYSPVSQESTKDLHLPFMPIRCQFGVVGPVLAYSFVTRQKRLLNRWRLSRRYASLYSRALLQMLREDGVYVRPLGNVIYLMCGPCTPPEICSQLLVKLQRNLEAFHRAHGKAETGAVTNAKPSSRPTHVRSLVWTFAFQFLIGRLMGVA